MTSAQPTRGPSPWGQVAAYGAVIIGVATIAALRFVESTPGNIDDAFILLVYVRHLIEHGQLYYNLSDGHVDGFTSPLDLIIKSLAIRLSPADPILVAWVLTLALHIAVALTGLALVARMRLGQEPRRRLWLAVVAGLLLASNRGLGYGSAFLLETPLFVLLGLLCLAWILRPRTSRAAADMLVFVGILLAFSLARPEAVPLSIILLGLHAHARSKDELSRWRLVLPLVIYGIAMGGYYLLRVSYFGYWAPNTYYAKTSASRWSEIRDGLNYVASFALSAGAPGILVLLFSPLLVFARSWRREDLRWRFAQINLLALSALGFVIYAGGDCYDNGRFLALPLVFSSLALVLAHEGLMPPLRRVAGVSLGVVLTVQLVEMAAIPAYLLVRRPADLSANLRDNVPLRSSSFACDAEASRTLASLAGREVVAQEDYQRLKYFADDLHVLDLTGLNEREIAHKPMYGQVLWGKEVIADAVRRRPAIWLIGHNIFPHSEPLARFSAEEALTRPDLSEKYLGYMFAHEEAALIWQEYVTASFRACGGYFNVFVRKDLASKLGQAGMLVSTGRL